MRDQARRRVMAAIALALAAATLSACAEPSSDYGDYRAKVKQSAKDAQSALATAQLMADEVLRGRTTLAYADTVVSDAENDVSAVQTAFDTRQPPDTVSIKLRNEFDNVLQSATTAAQDLRIAVRREDAKGIQQGLDEAAKAVAQLAKYNQ
jgi:ABC-type uncharacterized transport system auxiliary subunit